MSDVGTPTADQIIADLEAGQSAAPEAPAPAPQESATPASEPEPAAPAAGTPAPVVAEVPKAFKTKAAGEEIEVPLYDETGKINPQLVEAFQKAQDYTRKMQAVSEMRRQVESERLKAQSEIEAARFKMEMDALPKLPDDDPYAQHQAAMQKRLDALNKAQVEQHEALKRDAEERMEMARQSELAASKIALAAEEKRIAAEYGLPEKEVGIVEREYFIRSRAGEQVTLDSVAQERKAFLTELREATIKEFKDKHRVGSDAAGESVPAVGAGNSPVTPKSENFVDKFREDLEAALRR